MWVFIRQLRINYIGMKIINNTPGIRILIYLIPYNVGPRKALFFSTGLMGISLPGQTFMMTDS